MYATSFVVLQVCLRYYEHEFVELACQCPAVVCCRCSPTQKAQIVRLLQQHTANRTCAIGKLTDIGAADLLAHKAFGYDPRTAWENLLAGENICVNLAPSFREESVYHL